MPDSGEQHTEPTTFTQEQVIAMAAREKDQGRRAGASEVLSGLGFDSADALKAFVDAAKKAEAAQKTAEQKAADELAAKEKALAEREAKITEKARTLTFKSALVELGASKDGLPDALTLLSGSVAADADEAAVTAAAEALKERWPSMFTGEVVPGKGQPTGPRPPLPKEHTSPKGQPGALGRARALAMFGDRAKVDAPSQS